MWTMMLQMTKKLLWTTFQTLQLMFWTLHREFLTLQTILEALWTLWETLGEHWEPLQTLLRSVVKKTREMTPTTTLRSLACFQTWCARLADDRRGSSAQIREKQERKERQQQTTALQLSKDS
jgi:hypothetical protein